MSRQGQRQDWMSFHFQNLSPLPLFSTEVRAQMYERESIIVCSPFPIFDLPLLPIHAAWILHKVHWPFRPPRV